MSGDSRLLFSEMDANNDGVITRAELDGFLELSGLDGDLFDVAFENIDRSDGQTDGKVSGADLVAEFMRLTDQLKRIHSDAELTQAELEKCLNHSGLDHGLFDVAFENMDHTDGHLDGKINGEDLVGEFMRLVAEMGQGAQLEELRLCDCSDTSRTRSMKAVKTNRNILFIPSPPNVGDASCTDDVKVDVGTSAELQNDEVQNDEHQVNRVVPTTIAALTDTSNSPLRCIYHLW